MEIINEVKKYYLKPKGLFHNHDYKAVPPQSKGVKSEDMAEFVRLNIETCYFSGVAEHKDIVMASLNAILQGISGYLLKIIVSLHLPFKRRGGS